MELLPTKLYLNASQTFNPSLPATAMWQSKLPVELNKFVPIQFFRCHIYIYTHTCISIFTFRVTNLAERSKQIKQVALHHTNSS